MSFEWSAYADLAERLIEVRDDFDNDEACARTAISRCYYAAFGKAREDLEARGLMPSTANVHKGVKLAYDRGADKREKYIGRLLGGCEIIGDRQTTNLPHENHWTLTWRRWYTA